MDFSTLPDTSIETAAYEVGQLELPWDYRRPRNPETARVLGKLSGETQRKLWDLARAEKVAVSRVLLACFKILLHRLSAQEEVSVAVQGLWIIHAEFAQATFRSVLRQVCERICSAAGSETPLLMRSPESLRGAHAGFCFGATRPLGLMEGVPFDFCLRASTGCELELGYRADRFSAATAESVLRQFSLLLDSALASPDSPIGTLELLTSAEKLPLVNQELNRLMGSTASEGSLEPLHRLFEKQVQAHPERVALVYDDQSLTYAELNRRANLLAHRLRRLGAGPEIRVGLSVERSLELVIGVLGILKSGSAYVPLDPDYPRERMELMLSDSRARILVTEKSLRAGLPAQGLEVICLDDPQQPDQGDERDPELNVGPESLAYVIYTSGSTGTPKGALTRHGNAVRLFRVAQPLYGFNEHDAWTLFHSYAFDFSVWEIWGPLLHGGKLVVVPYCVSRSPQDFYELLCREKVTVLNQTPSAFFQLMREDQAQVSSSRLLLRYVILGGEALDFMALKPWFDRYGFDRIRVVNGYGPTETTVFATFKFITPADLQGEPISNLGGWLGDLRIYLVDRGQRLVAQGVAGEILIGGAGVARGYLNRPELTAQKFATLPEEIAALTGLSSEEMVYRTGDLARFLPDGQIEYLGRIDHQVKIRGFRIELGEIETVLRAHPAIREAAVVVREEEPGDKYLAAYVVPHAGAEWNLTGLRVHLASKLPDYMVPQAVVELEALPLSPHGKLDRKALPKPEQKRPDLSQPYIAPGTATEKLLAGLWCSLLKMDRVGIDDNFFDLGGTSLLANQMIARLAQEHRTELAVVKLFEHPTIAALAGFVDAKNAPASPSRMSPAVAPVASGGVAIIGMAGRFPGATTVEEFWKNLCAGRESTSFFEDHELDISVTPELKRDPSYVKARGVIEGVEMFDAAFFGIPPSEAAVMDPQHRVFLEVAWEALENSGYGPDSPAIRQSGPVGVYAGTYNNTYYSTHVRERPDLIRKAGEFQTMAASEKDYVATRVSYKLNLDGPSVSLYTACSTSLVAVSQAYFALLTGQCDMAIAGGVSVTVPQKTGHLYQEGSMLSKDGHTRTFDAEAQGTVFSDGAGAVILKRVEDAVRDGDTIYAVIRGAAINNDAAGRVSFTAPSVEGQAAVIRAAHERAGIDPRTISYVEAHGTATPLGDPIEVEALTQAFRAGTQDKGFCALGSVKSNLGHLTIAAGVTGLIKTSLSLKHEVLPGTLHFRKPNPKIDFAGSPFFVNSELKPWARGTEPRRAGISSFGVGGTNAHVVVEEAPDAPEATASRPRQLILLSAKTATALESSMGALRGHALERVGLDLADLAYTLNTGRKAFSHRAFAVAGSAEELASPKAAFVSRTTETRSPEIVFMFPGQGSQYVGMGKNLYDTEPVFRAAMDECAEILLPVLKRDLRGILYPASQDEASAAEILKATHYTQPALFAVGYSLSRLWMSWGVVPGALLGHSVGEFVAACLAGVFSLQDALRLVAYRGQLMQELPSGTMLSVRMSADQVAPLLSADVSIASINGPALCVVAGPHESVSALQARLESQGAVCRALQTSHAFHSSMMDPAVEPYAMLIREVSLSAPSIPIVSTVTGDWMTADQARDPMYWARHLRETVRFSDAVRKVWEDPARVLLEVGPRATLATLARQHVTEPKRQVSIASLSDISADQAEWESVLKALGQLWLSGVEIDWESYYAGERRRRVPLPTYPFERKRYWADRPQGEVVMSRKQKLVPMLKEVLEDTSGIDLSAFDTSSTFFEMGMDSLFLTQVATELGRKFSIKITFRQLLEDYANLDQLSQFIDGQLPADAFANAPVSMPSVAAVSSSVATAVISQPATVVAPAHVVMAPSAIDMPVMQPMPGLEGVVAQQLMLMQAQLQLLSRGGMMMQASAPAVAAQPVAQVQAPAAKEEPKAFGAQARINLKKGDSFTAQQRQRLESLMASYTTRTRASKAMAQGFRKQLADPRVVSGFRPELKELVYPIHTVRSAGSKLWDVDGHEYVDMSCGFGTNFFGNVPGFIKEAIKDQIDRGMEIGPSHPLAGEVAKLFCEMTGAERVAFCSTGSEAVLGCMRLARTITGRNLIVQFTGDYHGIFDEVIVRGSKSLKTTPAAPGIMKESVQNVLILDYGSKEALEIIRNRAGDIAGILVEPVQSRNPDLQPREFIHELRKLTEEKGIALIFDEVITGFRVAPNGAQEFYGVRADIASYGKVIGGGLPMGVIAGKAQWMDALDGGHWQFGDASSPTVGVTYFAGTYVRHPLALASSKAVLDELKRRPGCQKELNARTTAFVSELNTHFKKVGAPIHIMHFSSMMKVTYTDELAYGELLYTMMREKGVHVWDQRPMFLTLAHSEADIASVIRVFKECVADMQASGFMPGKTESADLGGAVVQGLTTSAPVAGARLGRDPQGNPAWYVADPNQPGKYVQVEA